MAGGARFLGRGLALAAAVFLVPACKDSSDDPLPLHVTFISPVGGATAVPRQPVVYVRFDRPLKPATVNSSTVGLTTAGGTVNAPVSYHAYLNEVRLVPSASLAAGTVHQVTLSNGIHGADDTVYGGSYFHFTTNSSSDIDRPAFSGASSAGNPTQTSIDLAWSAATDASPGIVYDVFLAVASGEYDFTDPYLASQSSPTGVTVTGLAAATTFYFVVRARDSYGSTDLNVVERSATTLP